MTTTRKLFSVFFVLSNVLLCATHFQLFSLALERDVTQSQKTYFLTKSFKHFLSAEWYWQATSILIFAEDFGAILIINILCKLSFLIIIYYHYYYYHYHYYYYYYHFYDDDVYQFDKYLHILSGTKKSC